MLKCGMEIFDDCGRKILGAEDLTKTIYGTGHTACKNGEISDVRIKTGETFILPYYSKIINIGNAGYFYAVDSANSPVFLIEKGKIIWTYFSDPRYGIEDVKFIYGGSI